MANITVSYAEMQQAAKHLGSGRDEITAKLQSMQTKIKELVSSGFVTDKASSRFEVAYAEYTKSAKTVILKLDEIETFLNQTAKAMAEMDAQIAGRIHG